MPLPQDSSLPEADERTSLLSSQGHSTNYVEPEPPCTQPSDCEEIDDKHEPISWTVLLPLLFGVFIAQADSSIVLATSNEIASEFNVLSDASWLITSYVLAQCACQPLYGKMSDIFGRKPVLVFAYIIFTVGCFMCGVGTEYGHLLAGRAISGIGGAGMVGMVAVIIADLLPVRQIATCRSYVNVLATLGRSCGGPVGGWLVETVGWRWCFLGQCPVAALAVLMILWKIPNNIAKDADANSEVSLWSKVQRVDVAGFITLPATLITAFIALDFIGKQYPMEQIAALSALFVILFGTFYYIEKYWAKEPILPIELICKPDVYGAYTLVGLQTASQFILTYTTPMYFQIVGGMSLTAAGSRIVCIVIGNTLGGLASGYIINRTGRYKLLTLIATMLGIICYTLVLIRWRGASGLIDTSYLLLSGLGMGTTQSTTFIHLAASLEAKDIAIAGTTWFLSQNAAMLFGANIFTMVHNIALKDSLESRLEGLPDKETIIQGVLSSVEYIRKLPDPLQEVVKGAFVGSFVPTNIISLVSGVAALVAGLFMRERKLGGG